MGELKLMLKKGNKICFISSSGGHLTQLLNVVHSLESYPLCLITEKNATTIDLSQKYKAYYLLQQDRKNHMFLFIFLANLIRSIYFYLSIRPKIIISTGAGCVVPFCFISKLFNTKIVYIESFAKVKTPTITGKLIYKIANRFYIQWPELKKYYPKAIYKGIIY
jgi:UDP-N-acetylglucosamine:LPS N-acetylglucosamine transferase